MAEISWHYYSLADMVRRRHQRERPDGKELHYELYPDSIASEYMRRIDTERNTRWHRHKGGIQRAFDILINIINKFPQEVKPNDNELVVHLRVGDVIEKKSQNQYPLLKFPNRYSRHGAWHWFGGDYFDWRKGQADAHGYVKSLDYYEYLLERLEPYILSETEAAKKQHDGSKVKTLLHNQISGLTVLKSPIYIPQVTIVSGGCGKNFSESKEYIQSVKSIFEKSGLHTEVRFGYPPDDDFVFLCRSKLFVQGGGGFSGLVNAVQSLQLSPKPHEMASRWDHALHAGANALKLV